MTSRFAAIGLLGSLLPLLAQSSPQSSEQVRKRLAEVQARLSQVDHQLETLKKRRKGVLVELQNVTLMADRARAQAEGARLKQDQTQAEVHQISSRKEEIRQEITRLRTGMRKQVRWMQALGPLGGLSFLPTLSSFEEFLVQGRYQAYWREQQRRRLDRVQHLQSDLMQREKDLQAALLRLAQEEKESALLQSSLKINEERLEEFLGGLRQDESKQKEIQAELAEEALQLERMLGNLLGKPRTEVFEAPVAFANLRGELPRPVEGTIAQGFGEHLHPKFHTKTVQSGLLIATAEGAPVRAVADGRVVFSEIYQSYGPMVILDHGGGYFSIYTHLRVLAVTKGQILKGSEQLGSAGDTVDGPRLGFEIRHMATPQDPNKWLAQKYR